MAVSKTKLKIIDVARQLIAKQGLDNITMNDIAVASGKGRRTLYTYFNNKEDVFSAVIEEELGHLSDLVVDMSKRQMSLEDKLLEFIFAHLRLIKEVVKRNGNLRAEFFRNIWLVEKARKNFDKAEVDFFIDILEEGNKTGEFAVEDVALVADVIHYCVKGLEVPYIYGRLGKGLSQHDSKQIVKGLIHSALKRN